MELTQRERRWLMALIVLATITAGFVVAGYVSAAFGYFSDLIFVFFLAWLLAFTLTPLVRMFTRWIPGLPRLAAVALAYVVLFGTILLVVFLIANSLAGSVRAFIDQIPTIQTQLPTLLDPWQARLDAIGFTEIRLVDLASQFATQLQQSLASVFPAASGFAFASVGVVGNLLIIVILSLYIMVDSDRILSFLLRLVPASRVEEAALLQTSVSRSFGGFLRGQLILGLVYGGIAAATSLVLGLPFMPLTTASAGLLMAIPFFGPFIAWAPPVIVAVFVAPGAILPALVVMGIGWLVVMNVLQPRIMSESVGLHPIVVLGSVLVGSKVGGIGGAIFGLPIAAVLSAFFLHFLGRARSTPSVTTRATIRAEERLGRPVRAPREPVGGMDEDVEPSAGHALSALRRRVQERLPHVPAHEATAHPAHDASPHDGADGASASAPTPTSGPAEHAEPAVGTTPEPPETGTPPAKP